MSAPELLIRECRSFEEYEGCVRLQTGVWGYDVRDTIPLREFIVIQHIGGQVIGAFDLSKAEEPDGDGGSLIGFAMAMPAVRDGRAYLHSHMLAVLPEYRNAGIGRRLKLAQRDEALARGLTGMEWTFDPLETKNAYLNIVRLGAIVRSYSPNFYGVFSSRLQAGLPTDRLHAVWCMDSPRVRAVVAGEPMPTPEIKEEIAVPEAIREWKESAESFARAEAAQIEIRARFLDAFARGLTVVGFTRRAGGEKCDPSEMDGIYQLANWRAP